MVLSILTSLISLVLTVGLIAMVVSSGRRRAEGSGGIDAHSVRRFFQYLLLAILFSVSASGLANLITLAFRALGSGSVDDTAMLARALAFLVIGGPLTVVLAWWTWRSVRRDSAEADSTLLTAYLTLMLVVSLMVTAFSLQGLLAEAFGRPSLDADYLGRFLAWGVVWLLHWLAARRFLDAGRNLPHLLLGSVIGLVMGTTGLVQTLGGSVDMLVRHGTYVNPRMALAQGLAMLIAGGIVWAWYWAVSTMKQDRNTFWLAYVLLAGVGGGLVLALVGASRVLWSVLIWLVGDRFEQSAALHFDTTAVEFAAVVVGLVLWWYHRTVLGDSAAGRNEVKRIYEYLISGIALAAAATGVGTILVAFIEAVTPGIDVGMTTRNTLLAALTLLVVGAPVWWLHWRRVSAAVAADPATEVPSLSRRIYLVVLFGLAGVTAVVALLSIGFIFFQGLVEGELGLAVFRMMRYGLGVMVASAVVSAYHGAIFAQDRKVAVPTRAVGGPASVILVGATPELAGAVRQATGSRVEVWQRLDVPPQAWDEAAVLAAVAGHAGRNVLVVADGQELRAIPIGSKSR